MVLDSFNPNPVTVTTPMITPAAAQAKATPTVLRAAISIACSAVRHVIRVSFLTKLKAMVKTMA